MEKIKLVIWDLDETFWRGTLSEEGIELIEKNVKILKELTNRGIVNSIASKNDYESAKDVLETNEIWKYFIFPSIEWSPKGESVNRIIKQSQLRPENVLFLDDNHLNLKEVEYYNSGIHCMGPEFIDTILNHPAFMGKDDASHKRLAQYKVLEKKSTAASSYASNIAFLESSKIEIEFILDEELRGNIDRVVELLERTNQLNYTKLRSNKDEVLTLLDDHRFKTGLVHVQDNYGDYGIVGFYALNVEAKVLKHFTFSCRVINLGIPQYIYSKLGFPSLSIVPEVVEVLNRTTPHWIHETDNDRNKKVLATKEYNKKKVLFKGGCDLSQMLFYLQNKGFSIEEETNYVSKDNFPIHQEHTSVLMDCKFLDEKDREYIENADYIPFTDQDFYKTSVFDFDYDCFIYSVLMDYTQECYKHKTRNITLPYGGYYNIWTNPENDNQLLELYNNRGFHVSKTMFEKFRDNFEYIGQIEPSKFINNLRRMREIIPMHIPMIILNGAELSSPNSKENASFQRHMIMNKALDEFISNSEQTYLLDVRKVIQRESQLSDNLRHYSRESYQKLSIELLNLLKSEIDNSIKPSISYLIQLKAFIIRTKVLLHYFTFQLKSIMSKKQ